MKLNNEYNAVKRGMYDKTFRGAICAIIKEAYSLLNDGSHVWEIYIDDKYKNINFYNMHEHIEIEVIVAIGGAERKDKFRIHSDYVTKVLNSNHNVSSVKKYMPSTADAFTNEYKILISQIEKSKKPKKPKNQYIE